MRWRAYLGVLAILVLLVSSGGTALALLVRHAPTYYSRVAVPSGPVREADSREFVSRTHALWNAIGSDRPWELHFLQDWFNGYLQEQEGDADPSTRIVEIPEEVHDIRVALEDDLVRVGFRYGSGRWSTVITVEFRMWLVARKTNVIALELCGFRAGALPLGTQVLLDSISEVAHRQNIDVTWYRNHGHPVALLQLQANQPRPTIQLRKLEVHAGRLVVAGSPAQEPGQSPPPAPLAASVPLPAP